MKRVRLASYTSGINPGGLGVYAANVLDKMQGNPNFPNATRYLGLLKTAHDDLLDEVNAANSDSYKVKARVLQVQKVLKALRAHVELECKDNEEIALSSGFDLVESASPTPKAFVVTQGRLSGSVDLECPFAGVRAAYIWEMAQDPLNPGVWQQFKITTSTVASLSGLVPGNKYWFRVQAIVKDEPQAYSKPLLIHVI